MNAISDRLRRWAGLGLALLLTITSVAGLQAAPTAQSREAAGDPTLNYSTYFGNSWETVNFYGGDFFLQRRFPSRLFVDANDNVYLIGETETSNFPTTDNVFQKSSPGGVGFDIVVSKIDPSRSGKDSLVYSTYLGGRSDDEIVNAFVTPDGNVFIVGETTSPNFPTTENAFARTSAAFGNLFIARLDPSKNGKDSLVYSTYFPRVAESGEQIHFDSPNSVWVSGT